MTTNHRSPGKPRPFPKSKPISIQAEIAADDAAAEPAPPIEQAAPEPVALEAIGLAVKAELAAPISKPKASSGAFDPTAWPLKTLDCFHENVSAIFDFAAALGGVKSLSDAIELQSKFASERYSTLLRQTDEFAELTRRLTLDASAPVRVSFAAFVS